MVVCPVSIRRRTHISKIILYCKYKGLYFSGLRLFLSGCYAIQPVPYRTNIDLCPPLFIPLATDIQGPAKEGLRFLIRPENTFRFSGRWIEDEERTVRIMCLLSVCT